MHSDATGRVKLCPNRLPGDVPQRRVRFSRGPLGLAGGASPTPWPVTPLPIRGDVPLSMPIINLPGSDLRSIARSDDHRFRRGATMPASAIRRRAARSRRWAVAVERHRGFALSARGFIATKRARAPATWPAITNAHRRSLGPSSKRARSSGAECHVAPSPFAANAARLSAPCTRLQPAPVTNKSRVNLAPRSKMQSRPEP